MGSYGAQSGFRESENAMDLNLKGKTAIVTGGARGLGTSICAALAAEGVNIVLNYVSSGEAAQRMAEEFAQKYGVKVLPVKANVSYENEVQDMFDQAAEKFDSVDILVNNAGICPVIKVTDISYSQWKEVMDINVNGVFLTCRAFARACMKAGKGGRIVNIVSQAAFNGSKRGKTHYACSKGAIVSFTVSFAKEVAADGIYVNAVAPGMILTDMTRETLMESGEMEKYNATIPLGRLADPAEIAHSVVFLASEAASYCTGSVFDVSGGMISR